MDITEILSSVLAGTHPSLLCIIREEDDPSKVGMAGEDMSASSTPTRAPFAAKALAN